MTLDTTSSHELLWTRDTYFADQANNRDTRAYCRCGWIVADDGAMLTAQGMRLEFIDHLEDLNPIPEDAPF